MRGEVAPTNPSRRPFSGPRGPRTDERANEPTGSSRSVKRRERMRNWNHRWCRARGAARETRMSTPEPRPDCSGTVPPEPSGIGKRLWRVSRWPFCLRGACCSSRRKPTNTRIRTYGAGQRTCRCTPQQADLHGMHTIAQSILQADRQGVKCRLLRGRAECSEARNAADSQ
jgi:hypothetical protein